MLHPGVAGSGDCQNIKYAFILCFLSCLLLRLVCGPVTKFDPLLQIRFASALSNYQTTIQHGGKFIFLIHDLWGADGTENSTALFPGDDGDWTSWDAYLTQWISDMKANSATANLVVDIWNEPDLTVFWNRPQAQWIQLWGRTYYRLRFAHIILFKVVHG